MPSIQIKNYLFKPSLIPTIITIALVYLMVSLAFWQFDRAQYKSELQFSREAKQDKPAIALEPVSGNDEQWLYQPVFVQGEYDQDHQFLYDNQVNNMVAGYAVFTPLKISDKQAVLVNRGWLPVGESRQSLPDLSIAELKVKIEGLYAPAPSKVMVLADNLHAYDTWPSVMQYIDLDEIQKNLDYELLPMVVIVDESYTDLKYVPIKINMRSDKHTAYAFQWFALTLALLIIYLVVNTDKLVTTKSDDKPSD